MMQVSTFNKEKYTIEKQTKKQVKDWSKQIYILSIQSLFNSCFLFIYIHFVFYAFIFLMQVKDII